MNDSPIRGQRPMQRRTNRPEQADVPPREPQPRMQPQVQQQPQSVSDAIYFEEETTPAVSPVSAPSSVARHQPAHKKAKKPFWRAKWVKPVSAIVVLGVGGLLAWNVISNSATGIKGDQYQAVFFSNGQVYFGKLHSFNADSMRLTDVYYMQNQSSDDSTSSDNPQSSSGGNAKLIKLGDEIHAPDDEMIIPKSQIQFYENIKEDGQVAQLMKKYQASN